MRSAEAGWRQRTEEQHDCTTTTVPSPRRRSTRRCATSSTPSSASTSSTSAWSTTCASTRPRAPIVTLDMTLTSAACPLTDVIEDQAQQRADRRPEAARGRRQDQLGLDAAVGPGQDHRRRPRAAARPRLQRLSEPVADAVDRTTVPSSAVDRSPSTQRRPRPAPIPATPHAIQNTAGESANTAVPGSGPSRPGGAPGQAERTAVAAAHVFGRDRGDEGLERAGGRDLADRPEHDGRAELPRPSAQPVLASPRPTSVMPGPEATPAATWTAASAASPAFPPTIRAPLFPWRHPSDRRGQAGMRAPKGQPMFHRAKRVCDRER